MPDPIKKTTSYDPSTGETTFKASWSNSSNGISRGPITPKTTQRTVAARQVSKPASKVVATRSESAGQRMAVAFKSPTPAGMTGMELKGNNDIAKMAPKKVKTAEQLRVENIRFSNEIAKKDAYEERKKAAIKQYPNKTPEKALEKFNNVKDREYKKEKREQKRGEREVERDWQSRIGGSGSKSAKKYGCPGGCK